MRTLKRCPNERGSWAHFMSHAVGQHLKHRWDLVGLLLALGYRTPYMERHTVGAIVTVPKRLGTVRHIKHTMWRNKDVIRGLYSPSMFVAPEVWPAGVEQVFGTNDPPTPYELACALLWAPKRLWWPTPQSPNRAEATRRRCHRGVLVWWLSGLPAETIATVLGIEVADVHNRLYIILGHLCRVSCFKIWAHGIDLLPYATSLAGQRSAQKRETFETLTIDEGKAYKKLVKHPIVKSQLTTGNRIGGLRRPISRPGVLWQTIEQKVEWESQSGKQQDFVRSGKERLRKVEFSIARRLERQML